MDKPALKDVHIVLKDVEIPTEWDDFSTETQKLILIHYLISSLHSVQIKVIIC